MRTYQLYVYTPLGEEQFFVSLDLISKETNGKIWNDSGEQSFALLIAKDRKISWSMKTQIPIESLLDFSIDMSENEESFNGEVKIDKLVTLKINGHQYE
jgi:hypothetical protein